MVAGGRLYYFKNYRDIFFSSHPKILAHIFDCDIDWIGILSILQYGASIDPQTVFKDIKSIPAGHFLIYSKLSNNIQVKPLYTIKYQSDKNLYLNENKLINYIEKNLKLEINKLRDRKKILLLSGGVDSSLIASLMADTGNLNKTAYFCDLGINKTDRICAKCVSRLYGIDLNIEIFPENKIIELIQEISENYVHPFGDFSTIPTYYILKKIVEKEGKNISIIDCNGGDDCFGFDGLIKIKYWKIFSYIPEWIKKLIMKYNQSSNITDNYINKLFYLISKLTLSSKEIAEFVQSPYIIESKVYSSEMINKLINNKIFEMAQRNFEISKKSRMEEIYSAIQITHVCSRLWTTKTAGVQESLDINFYYPYLGKNILNIQSKIPLELKIKKGEIKWPLKRILENYIPYNLIYRKKLGFTPPWEKWLRRNDIQTLIRDTIFRNNSIIKPILPINMIKIALDNVIKGKKLNAPILNLLWTSLFLELWLSC